VSDHAPPTTAALMRRLDRRATAVAEARILIARRRPLSPEERLLVSRALDALDLAIAQVGHAADLGGAL